MRNGELHKVLCSEHVNFAPFRAFFRAARATNDWSDFWSGKFSRYRHFHTASSKIKLSNDDA
jgi:uncharacterized protein YjlB